MKTKQSKDELSSSPISKKKKLMMIKDDDLIEAAATRISDLPEEVLTEVLVRLCVKDIRGCVCVQKSWLSLIKNRSFINLYSDYRQQKISNPNDKYLLFLNTYTHEYAICVDEIRVNGYRPDEYEDEYTKSEEYLTLKYPPRLDKDFRFQLVSNGLFCLYDNADIFTKRIRHMYLWNPVIQKYVTLPYSPRPPSSCGKKIWWKALAFGFVPEINDYVVVYMAKYGFKNKPDTHLIITCVYNLSTNTWKQIIHKDTHSRDICESIILKRDICEGIIVNGIAVWIGYNSNKDRILLCFDTKTEMLREILSPESHKKPPFICAFDQSIVYFVEKGEDFNEHDMWVLKGDPMNEFVWQKKMMIREKACLRVMGLRNNGEPILGNLPDLISYDLDSHKSYIFVKSWFLWTPFCLTFDEWGSICSWDHSRDARHFIIKPFAESLTLLDI